MWMLQRLPQDLQVRIVRWLGDDGRKAARRSCRGLRDLVRQWERGGDDGLRLYQLLRVQPDRRGPRLSDATAALASPRRRMLHVVCSLPHAVPELLRNEGPLLRPALMAQVFWAHRHDWRRTMRRLLALLVTLEERALLPLVRCWRLSCILPVYGYADSPDEFLNWPSSSSSSASSGEGGSLTFRERLLAALKGLTGLESVRLQLCAPHDHFNAATGRICCPGHGPCNLGQVTLLRSLVREALPSWVSLRELSLSDVSFRGARGEVDVVRVLLLALTRDAALTDQLCRVAMEDPWELRGALALCTRPGRLERLQLKHVMLSSDTETTMLFWLMVGAFPPGAQLELVNTGILWPTEDHVHADTGTIFPPAFYSRAPQAPAALFLALDLETNYHVVALERAALVRRFCWSGGGATAQVVRLRLSEEDAVPSAIEGLSGTDDYDDDNENEN